MTRMEKAVRKDWDIQGLISDLREAKWGQTEPNRIDRRTWLASYDAIQSLAKNAVPAKEWEEASMNGMEAEIVDDYMEVLAQAVMEGMGKELRREHVYATFEEGEGYIGQYEDMSAVELREMGFEIEGLR
jgi:hypothetical protein